MEKITVSPAEDARVKAGLWTALRLPQTSGHGAAYDVDSQEFKDALKQRTWDDGAGNQYVYPLSLELHRVHRLDPDNLDASEAALSDFLRDVERIAEGIEATRIMFRHEYRVMPLPGMRLFLSSTVSFLRKV